ncbi:MAG: hypothetical protein ACKN9V_01235 [Pseudomonadota bacterium]
MMRSILVLSLVFFSSLGSLGAPQNQDEEARSPLKGSDFLEATGTTSPSKMLGGVDVRPTVSLKGTDSFRFENSVELGYQFSPVFNLIYVQNFWTNLYNSSLAGGADGLGFIAQDGYLDWTRNQIFESKDKTLSLAYEGRLMVPTLGARREAGMITALRTYFILSKKLSESVSLTFLEIPIVHAFSQASHNGKANPIVENRVGLQVSFNLSKDLSFSFPLLWSATKMRVASGNKSSGAIENFVWINPELSYAVDSHYSLGMGYYDSSSLMSSDLSAFQIGEGLEDGVVQVFLRASL